MSKLYLYNYNNYLNRIVKKENSLVAYGTPLYDIQTTNFNPNDGITATHDINYTKDDGDYVIITDDESNIVSRWFVVESKRLRGGQYRLNLRRDIIVDNLDKVLNAPMIIHKGMVKYTNNLIFNKEGFNVNQIKTSETLLKDSHNDFPWLYIYMAKNAGDIEATVKASFTPQTYIDLQTPISQSIFATGTQTQHAIDIEVLLNVKYTELGVSKYEVYDLKSPTNSQINSIGSLTNVYELNSEGTTQSVFANLNTVMKPQYNNFVFKFIEAESTSYIDDNDAAILLEANNKLIRDSLGNYYKLTVTSSITDTSENLIASNPICQDIRSGVITKYPNAYMNDNSVMIKYKQRVFNIVATPQETLDYKVNVTQSNHQTTLDADYNIIAIPYFDGNIINGVDTITITKDAQMAMAQAIVQKATNQKAYDLQILPYSPYGPYCNGNILDISDMNNNLYQLQSYGGDVRNILLYIEWANFSFSIDKTINIPSLTPNQDINYKIANECYVWRLCSPNYNGVFEFNVAKNRGVEEFNIDITLKPYNPYLHVNPTFNGLYGQDYDDARGLICGGDFSLPIIGDAWQNYELNNKNYQIAFDRSIQNLDFMQGQERALGIVGAISGSLGGAAAGAGVGLMTAGPVGAAGLGAAGGALSAIGGVVDYAMLTARQEETKSFKIDNFKYQLGNIKALPYSLNKVTPLTFNNKIFPFIETYTCTSEEIEAFKNKIIYTGMTLEVIGTLANYITNYGSNELCFYKGEIIRLENLNLPSHERYEIYSEIEKGVYI